MSTAQTKTRLRLLDNLEVATPCNAAWDDMRGDERVRFCALCEKNVYNLSSLARDEAEALVREKEGKLCVRFFRRDDGTVLTADCPVGLRRRLYRRIASAAAGLGLLFVGLRTFAVARMGRPVTAMGAVAVSTPVDEPAPPGISGTAPAPNIGTVAVARPVVGEPVAHKVPKVKPPKQHTLMGKPAMGGPAMMGDIAAPPQTPAMQGQTIVHEVKGEAVTLGRMRAPVQGK
jgi:hypothetical protein